MVEVSDSGLRLRLPGDVKAWLEREAAKHGSSQNSEVIRAIRERMERVDRDVSQAA